MLTRASFLEQRLYREPIKIDIKFIPFGWNVTKNYYPLPEWMKFI